MIKCAIFDLDGTLNDDRWRLPFLGVKDYDSKEAREGINYDEYNSKFADDPWHLDILKMAEDIGKRMPIVIFTGRPNKYLAATVEKFRQLDVIKPVHFFMRGTVDIRNSVDLKKGFLKELRTEFTLKPVFAFDDRDDVCQMYIQNGITTFKVTHA